MAHSHRVEGAAAVQEEQEGGENPGNGGVGVSLAAHVRKDRPAIATRGNRVVVGVFRRLSETGTALDRD